MHPYSQFKYFIKENPVNFQPLTTADVRKIKSEKKQKRMQQKNKVSDGRKHLSQFRVLQKNLVYVVGLSQRMSDPDLLKRHLRKIFSAF